MQEQLQEIKQDVNDIKKTLHSMDKTLVRQEAVLEDHVRRSKANEEALELMKKELEPIKTHVQLINTLAKIIVGVGSVAGAILKYIGVI